MGAFEQAQFRCRNIKEARLLHIGKVVYEFQTLAQELPVRKDN